MTIVLERPLASALDQPQPDDGCQAVKGMCGQSPVVAVVHWEPQCDCSANPQRICLEHLGLLGRFLAEGTDLFECAWCGALTTFVRLVMLP